MIQQNSAVTHESSVRKSIAAQLGAAMLFGMLVVGAVGFAPMDVAHNAAHDARHALAFPCH